MKNIFLLFLLFWSTLTWSAPLHRSTAGGSWVTPGTWDIGVPTHNQTTTGDSISIESYVTLTDLLDVKNGSTIVIRAGDTLKIDGDVVFRNGAVIMVKAGAVLWITGDVTNNNNSNTITINGTIIVNGNFGGGNGSEIGGSGDMDIDGTVTTSGTGSVFGSTTDCPAGDCSSSAGSPLPIRLISFEAHLNNNNVQLNWATATEINNDFFTIEKSKDGKDWKMVSTVDGAGNSNQLVEYFDTDYSPFDGISYYRLKQTDFNGDFSYSNVIPVNFITDDKAMLSLFPNPVLKGQTLNIEINNTTQVETLVVLRDIKGQMFYSKTIINEDGNGLLSIPINNEISPGIYLITATSNDYFYSKRLTIK